MTELERALREDMDRLALKVMPGNATMPSPLRPTSALDRPIRFSRFQTRIVAFPEPAGWERLLERIWPNNPLSRFNRRARYAEELAYWKTVYR